MDDGSSRSGTANGDHSDALGNDTAWGLRPRYPPKVCVPYLLLAKPTLSGTIPPMAELHDIPDVLRRLDQVQEEADRADPLGRRDGLACFNYLYRIITGTVADKVDEGNFFSDNDYITTLDVVFASRYLDALAAYRAAPAKAPESWRVLIDDRANRHISPLQFAVAGVNAHVNYDLPFAVVGAAERLGRPLGQGSQRHDYQLVNDIFYAHMRKLRQHFEDRFEQGLDRSLLDAAANHVGDATVLLARDVAWDHGERIWRVRENAADMAAHAAALDRTVAEVSRGLLVHLLAG